MLTKSSDGRALAASRRWLPVGVLLVVLGLTALLGIWSVRTQAQERHTLLERRTEAFSRALSSRIQAYMDTLPGLRVFGVLNRSPNDADFLQYVEAISLQRRFPGLALTFVGERVTADRRSQFIQAVRGDRSHDALGHPEFDIRPVGDRSEYMVLRHLYPADPGGFGYDLYDPAQSYRLAVDTAVSTGGYVATGPILLARDRAKTIQPSLTSVVIRAATYVGGKTPASVDERRRNVLGVVGISFRTWELVQSVIPPDLVHGVNVRIIDPRAQREGRHAVIFDSDGAAAGSPAGPTARPVAGTPPRDPIDATIDVADRRWVVTVDDREPVGIANALGATWLLLGLGGALSVSLAFMTRILVMANVTAEEKIRLGTAELMIEKENLEKSEGRYRTLFENSLDAVLRTSPDGSVLAANPAACALFGWTETQMQTLGRGGLVDAYDPRRDQLMAIRSETGRARGQLRMIKSDGSVFEAEVASNNYVDGDARTVSSVIVRDVTERQARAEHQARLAAILDATPDFVGSTDPTGRTIFLNRAARQMLGRGESEDVSAVTISHCYPPWAVEIVQTEGIPTAIREGVWFGQTAILAADGHEIPVSQVILCHRNQNGDMTHWSTVARDLTELKRAEAERQLLESQLRESQKMESIGTLAGGVAHDFNNVLAAIIGNVALARQDLGEDHPTQPNLGRIQLAAARARNMVQQILTFSRRAPQERAIQPLGSLVEEAIALLRSTLPASARLEAAVAAQPLFALVDAAQVQQVVMNLCTNAWQALRDGQGLIQVALEGVEFPRTEDAPGGLPPGRYARLRVEDNGIGIDGETRERIFEPFFTTKQVGEGTGLGLAVVHGIISANAGAITVESQPGVGTCFDVYLPLMDSPAPELATAQAALGTQLGRGEQLLYVDDDEVVAITMQSLLQRAGYKVTCLSNGPDALLAVQAAPSHFSLVITDYNMPEMSGLTVAENIRRISPELPVVITSGYVTDEMQDRAHAVGVRAVLLKQYSLERLSGLVQRILSRAES